MADAVKARQLRFICTGRKSHPSYELGLIEWNPNLGSEGVLVMDADDADAATWQDDAEAGAPESRRRTTAAGNERVTKIRGIKLYRRGGGDEATYTFECPRCIRRPQRRSNDLQRIADAWHAGETPGAPFDVSNLD